MPHAQSLGPAPCGGFWTAELHRQQMAITNEMVRQMTDFWVRTWMAAISGPKPKRRR